MDIWAFIGSKCSLVRESSFHDNNLKVSLSAAKGQKVRQACHRNMENLGKVVTRRPTATPTLLGFSYPLFFAFPDAAHRISIYSKLPERIDPILRIIFRFELSENYWLFSCLGVCIYPMASCTLKIFFA